MTVALPRVEPYAPSLAAEWDAFVRSARNGTFLHERAFVGYHADRFPDASLLVREEDGSLSAVLPATARDGLVSSHRGLTYGGLLVAPKTRSEGVLRAFEAVLQHYAAAGQHTFVYRPVPWIHAALPCEEDRYALHLAGAVPSRRTLCTIVPVAARPPVQERRLRGAKKAEKAGASVSESTDLPGYWALLEGVLHATHGAKPVHSLAEIETLAAAFPRRIRLFTVQVADRLVAGTLIFETDRVARSQYIGANEEGKSLGALDLLFSKLLAGPFADKPFFDFGGSDGATGLNVGLVEQKEGFGGRSVAFDELTVSLASYRAGSVAAAWAKSVPTPSPTVLRGETARWPSPTADRSLFSP